MQTKQPEMPKLKAKLSLKKESLRELSTERVGLLDGVVGGTETGCVRTTAAADEV
jgi:hypothetical protein